MNGIQVKTILFKVFVLPVLTVTVEHQSKKLWGLINKISGKTNDKTSLIEYIKIDGIREYNSMKICNTFGNYFSTVGKSFANKIPTSKKSIAEYLKVLQSSSDSLFFQPTDVNEIVKLVQKLCGPRSRIYLESRT